jgi:hypothetical protein
MKTSSYLEKGLWKTYSEIQGSGIGNDFMQGFSIFFRYFARQV